MMWSIKLLLYSTDTSHNPERSILSQIRSCRGPLPWLRSHFPVCLHALCFRTIKLVKWIALFSCRYHPDTSFKPRQARALHYFTHTHTHTHGYFAFEHCRWAEQKIPYWNMILNTTLHRHFPSLIYQARKKSKVFQHAFLTYILKAGCFLLERYTNFKVHWYWY